MASQQTSTVCDPCARRYALLAGAGIATLLPLAHASAIGYQLIAGGSRRGSIALAVGQAGQSASASPLVNPVDPILPDNGWTGANITLGGAPPFANVLAQGEGRYWLSTTPDAIDLRIRTNAARNINGGINTSASASATTICSVPFHIPEHTWVTVTLSASRTGFPGASSFLVALESYPNIANIFNLTALGSETISFTLDPGDYRISAGANTVPGPNAGAGIEIIATVSGFGGGCPADFNGDGFLDFTDFDDFVIAFEGGFAAGDFNGDGFLDFTDFDDFVNAFEGGC